MKGRESGMPDEAYWQTFFNPECIVAKLDCAGPCDVVEFGSGYGLFTRPAAKLVSGTVYALDIEPEMVAATATRAVEAGCPNVVAQERDFLTDGCGRPDGSVGYAMLFTRPCRQIARFIAAGSLRSTGVQRRGNCVRSSRTGSPPSGSA